MNIANIERIKDLRDFDNPCYAVKIQGKYIIVYFKKHRRFYNKIFSLWQDKAMELASLKRKIQECKNKAEKEIEFNKLLTISFFIGD